MSKRKLLINLSEINRNVFLFFSLVSIFFLASNYSNFVFASKFRIPLNCYELYICIVHVLLILLL